MKKLGSVEKVEDFFLAVAGGADVNGTWRGSPLVEYFFTRSMQKIVFYPTKHPRAKEDADARKLGILIGSGADVSPIFSSAYGYYEYGNLVRLITKRADLLSIILASTQACEIIKKDEALLQDLFLLENSLRGVLDKLNDMK